MQKVSFGASGLPGYEVGPKNSPAVIVLQEWWGESRGKVWRRSPVQRAGCVLVAGGGRLECMHCCMPRM